MKTYLFLLFAVISCQAMQQSCSVPSKKRQAKTKALIPSVKKIKSAQEEGGESGVKASFKMGDFMEYFEPGARIIKKPSHGTFVPAFKFFMTDNVKKYVPDSGYVGEDTYTYYENEKRSRLLNTPRGVQGEKYEEPVMFTVTLSIDERGNVREVKRQRKLSSLLTASKKINPLPQGTASDPIMIEETMPDMND